MSTDRDDLFEIFFCEPNEPSYVRVRHRVGRDLLTEPGERDAEVLCGLVHRPEPVSTHVRTQKNGIPAQLPSEAAAAVRPRWGSRGAPYGIGSLTSLRIGPT